MANIKLSSHNWETSGIYDLAQEKTQRQINSDLNGAVNNTLRIVPKYTGTTDLDSVVAYAISVAQSNNLWNIPFTFRGEYGGTGSTGYFYTSSFQVICSFSSANYGFGIMMSDSKYNVAAFIKTASSPILYKVCNTDIVTPNVEKGDVATQNYSGGQYAVASGKLYRITADSVSSGGNIPNNGVETSITKELYDHVIYGEWERGTYNTAFCNGGNIYGSKIGRFFTLGGWIRLSALPSTTTDPFVTGLPAFSYNQNILCYDQNSKDFICMYAESGARQLTNGGYDFSGRVGHILNFIGTYSVNL